MFGCVERLKCLIMLNCGKHFQIIEGDVYDLKETIKLSSVKIMELTAEVHILKSASLGKDKQIAKYKSVIESKEGGFVC